MQNNIQRKVSFENKISQHTKTCPGLGDAKDDVRLPAPACQGNRSPGGAQKATRGQYAEAAAKHKWMHRNVTLFYVLNLHIESDQRVSYSQIHCLF